MNEMTTKFTNDLEVLEVLEGMQNAFIKILDKYEPDSIYYEWISHSHEILAKAKSEYQQ